MVEKKPGKSAEIAQTEPYPATPTLLSGGNPQIAKGYGDGPVQAYIAAMPGWKSPVGARIDALIESLVPGVRKAVKWNSPFYGMEDDVWFLSLHCFTKYIKVTFLNGVSLQPLPPAPPNIRRFVTSISMRVRLMKRSLPTGCGRRAPCPAKKCERFGSPARQAWERVKIAECGGESRRLSSPSKAAPRWG